MQKLNILNNRKIKIFQLNNNIMKMNNKYKLLIKIMKMNNRKIKEFIKENNNKNNVNVINNN